MYGEIYFHNYCLDKTGQNAALSILKRDYTGVATEVDAGVTPFRKTLLNNSEDRIGGVYPTSATIQLSGTPTFGMDDLHTADDSEYQVVHIIDGKVDWIGYLVPENFSEQEDSEYRMLDLKAVDGLTKLKDTKFLGDDGKNYGVSDGKFQKPFLFYITEALKKTGLDLDVLTLVDRTNVIRSNETSPITTQIIGNPFYSTQFNTPYADGKIAVGGYVELELQADTEFGGGSKFVSQITALDDSQIGTGGGLGVTINPPPPFLASTYTVVFFTPTAGVGDVLVNASIDARMWVDPEANIITDKSEIIGDYYDYTDGTYDAWYVLDSIARLFDVKVTQQLGRWVVETLDKHRVADDYYRYDKNGLFIDRVPKRDVKVFDCDSDSNMRLAGNIRFIDKTLKRVTVNYPYRYKHIGDNLINHILNGNFALPFKPAGGDPDPSTFTPLWWKRVIWSDPITMRYVREDYPSGGIMSQSIRIETPGDRFNFDNRLSIETPIRVSEDQEYILEWDQSILEYFRLGQDLVSYNNILIVLRGLSGKRYNLVNAREQEGWSGGKVTGSSNTWYQLTSPNPQGQWETRADTDSDLAFKSNYAPVHEFITDGKWTDFGTVKLLFPRMPEAGELTISITGVTNMVTVGDSDTRRYEVTNSMIPSPDLVDGTVVYTRNNRDTVPYETFHKQGRDLKVKVANMRLYRTVDNDFGRTVNYTNDGNYFDSLTVEVPLGDEDNNDHLSVINIGENVNNLWTDLSGSLGVETIGMLLAKTLMRRYLTPSYGVDGGVISNDLQFLDLVDLYDNGGLYGIRSGDISPNDSSFSGTLEEYKFNPAPENGYDGGANSLHDSRGGGSGGKGSGGGGGGAPSPAPSPQDLQSVTDIGNVTTNDMSARGLRVSDFLVVPSKTPDASDVVSGQNYIWVGSGATAGQPVAGTLAGLSDVALSSPLVDKQVLQWDASSQKWINGVASTGGGIWGAITGVLSDQTDLQTALNGKANLNHTHDASAIISGILNIARIPTGTTGATVALGNHTHTFAQITNKPTTIAGYGITDAYTKSEVNGLIPAPQTLSQVDLSDIAISGGNTISLHSLRARGIGWDVAQLARGYFNTGSQGNPLGGSSVVHGVVIPHGGNTSYGTSLVFRNNRGWFQSLENGVLNSWVEVATREWANSQGWLKSADISATNGIAISAANVISPVYGTTANTIAQGNDSRIINGQTAYSWGDYRQYGLGTGITNNPFFTDDLFLINNTELIRYSNSSDNTPDGDNGFMINLSRNTTYKARLALSDSKRLFFTAGNGDATWKEIYHTGNLRSDTQNDQRYMQVTHPANSITLANISNWNTAFSEAHTHTNKSLLDVIDQQLSTTSNVVFSGAHIQNSLRIPTVAPTSPANGNIWVGDGATAGTPVAGTLSGLSDVDITAPTNGQGLVWNANTLKWENATISTGGGIWGTITGVLSDQTDLQTALNGKANLNHTHDASAIISGILNIARIPTGTTGATVALGNHTHTFAQITNKPTTIAGYGITDAYTKSEVNGLIPAPQTLSQVDLSDIAISGGNTISLHSLRARGIGWDVAQLARGYFNTGSQGNPLGGSSVVHGVVIPHGGNTSYGTSLVFRNNRGWFQSLENGVLNSWVEVATREWANSQGWLKSADISATNGIAISAANVISPVYGTTANTIAQGNDSRIINGQTAYSWGDYRQYGLGTGITNNPFFTDDLFLINNTELIRYSNSSDNTPDGDNGFMINLSRNTTYKARLALSDSKRLFFTAGNGDATWKEIYHTGNLRSDTQNDQRYLQINSPSFNGSAASLTTARNIAMTGDVAWSVSFNGSANVSAAGTIANGVVTNAKMANMAANTFKGRLSSAGAPQDLTASQMQSALNIPSAAKQSAWDGAVSLEHSHANKALLDTINQNMGTANTVSFSGIVADDSLSLPTSAPSNPQSGRAYIWVEMN